ncbi:hypothetical protein GCM10028783_27100 [Modestobacter muralis]
MRTERSYSPSKAIALAGGTLRHLIEGAARYANLDLGLSSSRLVSLVGHGLDRRLLEGAHQLTALEVAALFDHKPSTEEAHHYISVADEIASRVLEFSAAARLAANFD